MTHTIRALAHTLATLAIATLATLALVATLPPCEFEDSQWCAWNASQSGNGTGQSFIDLGGFTIYTD